MEPLPRGSQFIRAKTLWEVALDVAGDFAIPYTGNRDICISIGSGSGETFRPWLRMSVGSPILAHAVVRGELEMAFVNPSAFLTQAYRGTGLFSEPLPVRVVANYPSWDRYVQTIHPRTGITSLAQVKEQKYPLRLSIREDPTHSTRVLIDQIVGMYGFTVDDVVSWGGSLQLNGPPSDPRRLDAIRAGEVDAVLDEGIPTWLDLALEHGMWPLSLDENVFQQLQDIGWRRVTIPPGAVGASPICRRATTAWTTAAGRCTHARRWMTRRPTRSAPRSTTAATRSPGRRAPTPAARSLARTPRPRRWTCRSTPARRSGSASRGIPSEADPTDRHRW
jgi:hypothetical protein